ncbi:MAG TPA: zinc ribbon domain-containing protein [Acidobacteriota bacterium]
MLRKIIPLLLLLTAGCVDLEVRTEFQADGSGVQVWRFTSSALLATQVRKFVDSYPLLKNGVRIWDEYRKGEYLLGVKLPFKKVQELQDNGRQVRFETKGWLQKTCTYTETWADTVTNRQGPFAEQAGNLIPVKLRWLVLMPGKIVESNADEITDNQAVWVLTLTEYGTPRTFTARSNYWNIPAIVLLSIAAFAIIALIFFARGKRTERNQIQCRKCGAIVRSTASFCSSCGKSTSEIT